MRDQLAALTRLSEIDAAARNVDAELKEIPARIDDLRSDVQRLEELLARERQQLAEAERLKQEQIDYVAQRNELLSRARAKSAKARNTKEADAVEREVESNRRMIKEREEEVGRLDETVTKVRSSLAEHEKEFNELRNMFSEEEAKGRTRIAELQQEREKVTVGRDDVVQKLEKNVFRRYEQIRQRRGSAIAEIIDGTCKGCRMQIPAQEFVELQRGDKLQQCPHCLRILIYKPLIED